MSDGSCAPPLASAGVAAPFGGSTDVVVRFQRVPSMHAPGDDEGVLDFLVDGASIGTDMGPSWFVGPAALVASTPPALGAYTGTGHGTPGSIPNIDLTLVTGGGGACSP